MIYWVYGSLLGEHDTKQDAFNKLIKTSPGPVEHIICECVWECAVFNLFAHKKAAPASTVTHTRSHKMDFFGCETSSQLCCSRVISVSKTNHFEFLCNQPTLTCFSIISGLKVENPPRPSCPRFSVVYVLTNDYYRQRFYGGCHRIPFKLLVKLVLILLNLSWQIVN